MTLLLFYQDCVLLARCANDARLREAEECCKRLCPVQECAGAYVLLCGLSGKCADLLNYRRIFCFCE